MTEYARLLDRIRQRQSLYRLAFDDRRVTRAILREQAENFEEWLAALVPPVPALDIEALRRAIYTVSVRHDWENTTDREDRTAEIAAEYARLVGDR